MWPLNLLLQYFNLECLSVKIFCFMKHIHVYLWIVHVNSKQNGWTPIIIAIYGCKMLLPQTVHHMKLFQFPSSQIWFISTRYACSTVIQHSHHKMFSLKWKIEKTVYSFDAFNNNNYIMSNYTLITHWSTMNKNNKIF